MYTVNGYYSNLRAIEITMTIIFIISIAGALVTYFLFLSKKNEGRFHGFVGWLYDFLSFKKLMLESLLNILYLFCAILITLLGLYGLFEDFFAGILSIIFGNILIRMIYEFAMLRILTCKNTSEINSKMNHLISPSASKKVSGQSYSDPFMKPQAPSSPRPQQPSRPQQPQQPSQPVRPQQPIQPVRPQTPPANVCPSCGNKIKPTAKFCPYCGAKR